MTQHEAVALLAQIDLIPKRKHFEAHNLAVDSAGRASVEIVSDASPGTICRWFDDVGAWVSRIENIRNVKGQRVTFDWK